jgi:hypothetical protein
VNLDEHLELAPAMIIVMIIVKNESKDYIAMIIVSR